MHGKHGGHVNELDGVKCKIWHLPVSSEAVLYSATIVGLGLGLGRAEAIK